MTIIVPKLLALADEVIGVACHFAALHASAFGTSRRFAAAQQQSLLERSGHSEGHAGIGFVNTRLNFAAAVVFRRRLSAAAPAA
jgi:hypothetical protein